MWPNKICSRLLNIKLGVKYKWLAKYEWHWWTVIPQIESGATSVENESNPENTWDSKKWLQKYGLKAQGLSFYDVLADCSFRHADGVVDVKAKPGNESVQTSAVSEVNSWAWLWASFGALDGWGPPQTRTQGKTKVERQHGGKPAWVSTKEDGFVLPMLHFTEHHLGTWRPCLGMVSEYK